MMRFLFPLLLGVAGFAVLMGLGLWQLERLAWKEGVLAEIEARISAEPVALPQAPDPEGDRYLPVTVAGQITGAPLHVLVSQKTIGAGYRVIAPLTLSDGRKIMADLGVIPLDAKETPLSTNAIEVTGNLHWPDEVDGFTPEPDAARGIWFARDVPRMAEALSTEPVLVIARILSPVVGPVPLPVGTEGIPNSHLGYAIQWFGLALVWLGMTVFLLWRIRRRDAPDGPQ